jgi:hypothetical protein
MIYNLDPKSGILKINIFCLSLCDDKQIDNILYYILFYFILYVYKKFQKWQNKNVQKKYSQNDKL